MQRTVVVGLLMIVPAVARADEGVRALDSAPLGVVGFERGSSRVQRESMGDIQAVATWQARHPDALLVLEGHTSREGSSTRNVRISENRTDAVRSALISAGADPTRMIAVAHSDSRGDQVVVVRATDAFPDLTREQRDPNIGEDARRAGRATEQRAAPPTTTAASPGPGTVIVVTGAATRPPETATESDEVDYTPPVPAGGMAPTSGGNGIAAQTGIGMDPTDGSPDFTTGYAPPGDAAARGDSGGAPGLVLPPGPPVLVLPPGAPGARPPGSPGGQVAGAPTE